MGIEKMVQQPGEGADIDFDLMRRDLSYRDTTSQTWVSVVAL